MLHTFKGINQLILLIKNFKYNLNNKETIIIMYYVIYK